MPCIADVVGVLVPVVVREDVTVVVGEVVVVGVVVVVWVEVAVVVVVKLVVWLVVKVVVVGDVVADVVGVVTRQSSKPPRMYASAMAFIVSATSLQASSLVLNPAPKHATVTATPEGPRYSDNADDSASAVAEHVSKSSCPPSKFVRILSYPIEEAHPIVPVCSAEEEQTPKTRFKTLACAAHVVASPLSARKRAAPPDFVQKKAPMYGVVVWVVVWLVVVVGVVVVVTVVVVVGVVVVVSDVVCEDVSVVVVVGVVVMVVVGEVVWDVVPVVVGVEISQVWNVPSTHDPTIAFKCTTSAAHVAGSGKVKYPPGAHPRTVGDTRVYSFTASFSTATMSSHVGDVDTEVYTCAKQCTRNVSQRK